MTRILTTIFLSLLASMAQAGYGVRAASCDGCTKAMMFAKATETAASGFVYVFNRVGPKVRKFEVETTYVLGYGYTEYREAHAVPVESGVRTAWEDYVLDNQAVLEEGVIELPPNFGIRSVAGALAGSGWSTTMIEDQLREMSQMRQLELTMSTLLSHLIAKNIPFADISGFLKAIKITVRFPDGSTMDYEVQFSTDALTGEAQLELTVLGNARLHNGDPAPTSAYGFSGQTFNDRNGSLREWILWAGQLGLSVSGGSIGTTMTCKISGSEIRCKVTASR